MLIVGKTSNTLPALLVIIGYIFGRIKLRLESLGSKSPWRRDQQGWNFKLCFCRLLQTISLIKKHWLRKDEKKHLVLEAVQNIT